MEYVSCHKRRVQTESRSQKGAFVRKPRNKAIYLLIQMLIDPLAKLLLLMAAIQIAGNNEFVIN